MRICNYDSQGFCVNCGLLRPFRMGDIPCGRHRPHGIGTHLKILLRRFGIYASPSCKCNDMAKRLNQWTPDEAEARKAEIIAVMREEASNRQIPFSEIVATLVIRRAIANARKEAQRVKGTS